MPQSFLVRTALRKRKRTRAGSLLERRSQPKRRRFSESVSDEIISSDNNNAEFSIRSGLMAERLFFLKHCSICQVKISGLTSAQQHLDSSRHKRKEEIARSTGLSSAFGLKHYCKVCNIACDTKAMLEIHERSDRHRETARKADDMRADIDLMSSGLEALNLKTKQGFDERAAAAVVTQSPAAVAEFGKNEVQGFKDKYYEMFSYNRGTCYVCQIELSSRKHAEQHLTGQKHQKAVKVAQAHEVFYGTTSLPVQERAPSSTCSDSEHHTTNGQFGGHLYSTEAVPQRAFPLSQNSSLTISLMEDPMPRSPVPSQKPLLNTASLLHECNVCNKKMNTYEQLLLHNESEVHVRKARRLNSPLPSVDNTIWYPCPHCGKQLNSVKSLRNHLADGHKLTEAVINDIVDEQSPRMSNSPLPSVDNTIWYPCPHCGKPLNSVKSLRNHFADGHKLTEAMINNFFDEQRAKMEEERHSRIDLRSGEAGQRCVATTQSSGETVPKFISSHLSEVATKRVGLTNGASSSDLTAAGACDHPRFDHGLFYKEDLDVVWNIDHEAPLSSRVRQSSPDENNRSSLGSGSTPQDSPPRLHQFSPDENVENNEGSQGSGSPPQDGLPRVRQSSAGEDMESNGGSQGSGSPPPPSPCNIMPAVYERDQSTPERKFHVENGNGIWGPCGKLSCLFHCDVCGLCLNSIQQRWDHKVGTQHAKKLLNARTVNRDPTTVGFVERMCTSPRNESVHYCALCNASMNTQKDYDMHLGGQQHAVRAARKVPAPDRVLEPVSKSPDRSTCRALANVLTVSDPRSYQVELYVKAMETDAVCFLPTGTGKTLVSILVISHMLRLNPRRPVVFLVDRIILVVQQSEAIRKQIGDQLFTRWNESTGQPEKRRLRIAELCSGKRKLNESEVWEQDVIVVTADYYNNLLESGSLRWADNCLVVFDEIHHCAKQHTYRVILEKARLSRPDPSQRPKILGLTASPAGNNTVNGTVTMLQNLLSRIGDHAKLITVEEAENVAELQRFQSNTELVIHEVKHSKEDVLFRDALHRYLVRCWACLMASAHIPDEYDLETMMDYMEDDDPNAMEVDIVDTVCRLSEKLGLMPGTERNVGFKILRSHVDVLIQAMTALQTFGMMAACRELSVLLGGDYYGGFSAVAPLGLPCETVVDPTRSFLCSHKEVTENLDDDPDGDVLVPVFPLLVNEIVERCKIKSPPNGASGDKDKEKPLVLVLVSRRKDAQSLARLLGNSKILREHAMAATYVVGHGNGSDGMTVSAQERVLKDIREHKFQIIVATSVAEEGLDFPLCELVVQLNPPSSVRALVQIRGRARKKGSRFVAFCQTPEQKRSFNELREQEEHMIKAVRRLTTKTNADVLTDDLIDLS